MRNTCDTFGDIPASARELEGFRTWAHSIRFPERGRIDFLAGTLEVDMSPEDLYTHGVLKTEIASRLHFLVTQQSLGNVFIDRTRVSNPAAGLSVEPDLVVVLWKSIDEGTVREVPAAQQDGKFIELEGGPDLVVEIVSEGSARKDLVRLPELYAAAGVPELWLADARRRRLRFEIRCLGPGGYRTQEADAEGWVLSPRLGRQLRLSRREVRPGRWEYLLEHREPGGEPKPLAGAG